MQSGVFAVKGRQPCELAHGPASKRHVLVSHHGDSYNLIGMHQMFIYIGSVCACVCVGM